MCDNRDEKVFKVLEILSRPRPFVHIAEQRAHARQALTFVCEHDVRDALLREQLMRELVQRGVVDAFPDAPLKLFARSITEEELLELAAAYSREALCTIEGGANNLRVMARDFSEECAVQVDGMLAQLEYNASYPWGDARPV